MMEDDLDNMAARLKEEWGVKEWRPTTLAKEHKPIADKLLGKDESQRLQNWRANSRPFKPKKPIVVAEYYEVPSRETSYGFYGGGWRIDIRVNGIIHKSVDGLDRVTCTRLIAGCQRRGVQIKPIITEWMKQQPPKPENRRKAILEDLGGFSL
ncbi:hypothetical protein GRZ55_11695 [Chelativorans sp. ZYF759]|uniref:hypothetical protein n=1 Tax=Chelativorans sp. ZYF759 TaxID=2692213 RepID=UPI00145EF802|nr:hypothetical protein [Chelativorans sp. ZYF759]NMG39907.1 hypothetical protein [Chelativorans sp. ZYF759]